MPRYSVDVTFTSRRALKVYARDKQAAAEKAAEIVSDWKDVLSAEAGDVTEIDADD